MFRKMLLITLAALVSSACSTATATSRSIFSRSTNPRCGE